MCIRTKRYTLPGTRERMSLRDRAELCSKRYVYLFILVLWMFLCGFLFTNPEMILDTEKTVVYQHESIDNVLADFAADGDSAKENYHKAKIVLLGKVSELSENGKTVTLVSVSGEQGGSIKCSSSDEAVISRVKMLSQGDTVNVYGRFSLSLIGSNLTMDISKIENAPPDSASRNCYSLFNGTTVDLERMDTRTLASGKITYYIPKAWSSIEYNLAEHDLGTIEGFQYRLNEIPQSAAVLPESFFVCYFDNKYLKNSSDKTKTEAIERAVIANILNKAPDKLDKFPVKTVDTYYGAKYQYYQDAYKDPLGQGHHVEFVFQPVDNDGIIVYLYVYNDANHVDDIMFLMRLLEVH